MEVVGADHEGLAGHGQGFAFILLPRLLLYALSLE